jgi:hypothetical protein
MLMIPEARVAILRTGVVAAVAIICIVGAIRTDRRWGSYSLSRRSRSFHLVCCPWDIFRLADHAVRATLKIECLEHIFKTAVTAQFRSQCRSQLTSPTSGANLPPPGPEGDPRWEKF